MIKRSSPGGSRRRGIRRHHTPTTHPAPAVNAITIITRTITVAAIVRVIGRGPVITRITITTITITTGAAAAAAATTGRRPTQASQKVAAVSTLGGGGDVEQDLVGGGRGWDIGRSPGEEGHGRRAAFEHVIFLVYVEHMFVRVALVGGAALVQVVLRVVLGGCCC